MFVSSHVKSPFNFFHPVVFNSVFPVDWRKNTKFSKISFGISAMKDITGEGKS